MFKFIDKLKSIYKSIDKYSLELRRNRIASGLCVTIDWVKWSEKEQLFIIEAPLLHPSSPPPKINTNYDKIAEFKKIEKELLGVYQ